MEVTKLTYNIEAWIHGGDKVAVAEEQEVTLKEFKAEEITHVNGAYYPFHAFDALAVEETTTTEEVADDNCDTETPIPPKPDTPPTIEGADDVTIDFGASFNPREGVTATDGLGNEIPFEISGNIDTEVPGEYELTYTATDEWGNTTELKRTVTVSTPKTGPVFSGIENATANQGVGVDLTSGVSAKDATGKEVDFTVNPVTIDKCEVGPTEVTYTATDEWGNETTAIRTITVKQIDNPVISGLTELTVEVGEEFNPLEGVTAKDGNGNDVEVEVVEPETQEKALLNVTNYTASNPNRMDKADPVWVQEDGTTLVTESEDVVIVLDGTEYPTTVEGAWWDGQNAFAVQPTPVGEIGKYCYVWFYTDASDNSKFYSLYTTESGESVPDEVRFGKLIVKQILGS